jgi:hypothetical protein
MVIYEVTAVVEPEYSDAYEHFMLEQHIPDLMVTGRFTNASFERSDTGRYKVRYEAADAKELNRYLADDAPRLRRDFAERFPTGVDLSREEWTVLKQFA